MDGWRVRAGKQVRGVEFVLPYSQQAAGSCMATSCGDALEETPDSSRDFTRRHLYSPLDVGIAGWAK